MKRALLILSIFFGLAIKSHAGGLGIYNVGYDVCVATTISLTNATVSTVPVSVQFSTSATGSPVQTINNYKFVEFQNTGQVDYFVGFTVGVLTTTGHQVSISSGGMPIWGLPAMENVKTWLIPNGVNGRAQITLCR